MSALKGGQTFTLKAPCIGQTFGNWEVTDVLSIRHKKMMYEVDLERCHSSAKILDFILQLHGKGQNITNDDFRHLMEAIVCCLKPQANFCSWGQDKRPDLDSILSWQ